VTFFTESSEQRCFLFAALFDSRLRHHVFQKPTVANQFCSLNLMGRQRTRLETAMAIWSVSRVASSHASVRAMPDRRRNVPVDGLNPAAEPELALGLRLFRASILAMTLVVAIPITLGWMLRPAPNPTPAAVIRPAILADRVDSPKVVTPRDLPKAQAPPLELLHSPSHVTSQVD
jgi:hypothetical protein